MEGFRPFAAAVAARSLILAVAAAACIAFLWHLTIPALSLLAGTLIGLAYLQHIASSFNRLVKGGKKYLIFLSAEAVIRVLLAGAAPFLIVGRGPWQGYFTYLAGFVAPLAVAILLYRQQITNDRPKAAA